MPKLDPKSDAHRFAVVGLKRRLNHVMHQVKAAAELIDGFEREMAASSLGHHPAKWDTGWRKKMMLRQEPEGPT